MNKRKRKFPAAACQKCGGWTSWGGCSQLSDGPKGCKCHSTGGKQDKPSGIVKRNNGAEWKTV